MAAGAPYTRTGARRSGPRDWSPAAIALAALLVLPPLPFGSRDPEAVAAFAAVAAAGLILVPAPPTRGQTIVLAALAALGACYGLVLHEQTAAAPWMATAQPTYAAAAAVLGHAVAGAPALVRDAPWTAIGPTLLNLGAVALGVAAGSDTGRARSLLRLASAAGLAYAAFGILAFAIDPTSLLWREKVGYLGNLTGTFVNRNTAAAYFGGITTIWFLLALESARAVLPPGPVTWRTVPSTLLRAPSLRLTLRTGATMFCLAATLLTSSRAGALLTVAAMTAAFTLYFSRDLPRRYGLLAPAAGAALLAAALLPVVGSNVLTRIDLHGLSDDGRLAAYASTIEIIRANPWLGTGLGTFASAFPPVRGDTLPMNGVWDIAHSTPLELAAEAGLPLAAAVVAAWAAALGILAYGLRHRRERAIVPMAALIVGGFAALHSTIDFPLQVPGYSTVVCALLGIGLAQALQPRLGKTGHPLSISGNIRHRRRDQESVQPAGPA